MKPRVTIAFTETEGTIFTLNTPKPAGTNVSHIDDIVSNFSQRNPKGFQLSSAANKLSDLTGEYVLFGDEGFSGLIAKNLTGPIEISLNITDTSARMFMIMFDPASGEYARKVTYTAGATTQVFQNSSVLFVVSVPSTPITNPIKLTFSDWSVTGHSFKISRIQSVSSWVFKGASVIDFTCSENLMDSDLSLTPGVCEQYADITIYDRDNYIHALALSGSLNRENRLTVEMLDAETLTLGTYVVSDWDVDNDDDDVVLHCRDKSYLFESINLPRTSVTSRTLNDILTSLFNAGNFTWQYADSATAERCSSIVLPNSFYEANNMKELLTMACSLGMLRVYWYIDTFIVGRCE